jgi:hypothetical protein
VRYLSCTVIVLVLLFGGSAAAEPIPISSGLIVFTDEPGAFDIAGSGFEVSLGWFPRVVNGTFWFDRCRSGCAPGTTLDFGTTTYAFSESFQGGGGEVNGVQYPQLFTSGELTFVGPKVVLPTDFLFDLTGAFTFQGNVAIFTTESRTGPPVFASELSGAGTARVIGGGGSLDDLEYTFNSPVPEPSTLIMLFSGLVGGATVLRRRAVPRRSE